MNQAGKTQLAKGARKAEAKGKLDGRIESKIAEIKRLHNEIMAAAKMSLRNAIEIGKHLCRIRASRKGKWIKWIEINTPFLSQRTAYNYIGCYERRDELKLANVANLSDAYALLNPPKKARPAQRLAVESQSNGEAVTVPEYAEPVPIELEPDEQPAPATRHKSQKQIMKQLQNISEREQKAEKEANDQLAVIIATLNEKVRAQWLEFPKYLAAHGKALIELSERLQLNTPRS